MKSPPNVVLAVGAWMLACFAVGLVAPQCTAAQRQEAKTVSLTLIPLEHLACAVVRLERPSEEIGRACELADDARMLVEDLQAAAARQRDGGLEDARAALH